jgi:hypothetical protein
MTVFGVRGVLSTPTMDVAEAAGISRGTGGCRNLPCMWPDAQSGFLRTQGLRLSAAASEDLAHLNG